MAKRNGPALGERWGRLRGCVRAADTIPILTVAQIVPFTVAYFEKASGPNRPVPKIEQIHAVTTSSLGLIFQAHGDRPRELPARWRKIPWKTEQVFRSL